MVKKGREAKKEGREGATCVCGTGPDEGDQFGIWDRFTADEGGSKAPAGQFSVSFCFTFRSVQHTIKCASLVLAPFSRRNIYFLFSGLYIKSR